MTPEESNVVSHGWNPWWCGTNYGKFGTIFRENRAKFILSLMLFLEDNHDKLKSRTLYYISHKSRD